LRQLLKCCRAGDESMKEIEADYTLIPQQHKRAAQMIIFNYYIALVQYTNKIRLRVDSPLNGLRLFKKYPSLTFAANALTFTVNYRHNPTYI
jgi:hypothetical protein